MGWGETQTDRDWEIGDGETDRDREKVILRHRDTERQAETGRRGGRRQTIRDRQTRSRQRQTDRNRETGEEGRDAESYSQTQSHIDRERQR